jgi:hypothetical protein
VHARHGKLSVGAADRPWRLLADFNRRAAAHRGSRLGAPAADKQTTLI